MDRFWPNRPTSLFFPPFFNKRTYNAAGTTQHHSVKNIVCCSWKLNRSSFCNVLAAKFLAATCNSVHFWHKRSSKLILMDNKTLKMEFSLEVLGLELPKMAIFFSNFRTILMFKNFNRHFSWRPLLLIKVFNEKLE